MNHNYVAQVNWVQKQLDRNIIHPRPQKNTFYFKLEIIFLFFLIWGHLFIDLYLQPASVEQKTAKIINPVVAQTSVLGESTSTRNITSTPPANRQTAQAPLLNPSPTQAITPTVKLKKESYTIAIIGDSMVDTMGERLEYLEHALTKKYPGTHFKLYNYGRGAENVEDGYSRLENPFKYQDRDYSPLREIKADIIIVGSYAYNPFAPYDRDRHWLGLTRLVKDIAQMAPQVYMLAEIAPLRTQFGKGPNGVNWDQQTAYDHSGKIIQQLENAVGLSSALKVPLVNAFTPSLSQSSQKEGKSTLVNPSDGIHPSIEGHDFTARIIVEALKIE